MEAERDGHKYKQVEFISKHIGEEFDAVISGVANFGFWAQTTLHRCEGFVSLLNLDKVDEFQFIEEEYALVGKRTKQKFQIGKSLKIKVIRTSLEKKQIDYDLVS
jgi:ribonuclease R